MYQKQYSLHVHCIQECRNIELTTGHFDLHVHCVYFHPSCPAPHTCIFCIQFSFNLPDIHQIPLHLHVYVCRSGRSINYSHKTHKLEKTICKHLKGILSIHLVLCVGVATERVKMNAFLTYCTKIRDIVFLQDNGLVSIKLLACTKMKYTVLHMII